MTARRLIASTIPDQGGATPVVVVEEPTPFSDSADPVAAAHQRIVDAALTAGPGGQVGLELELHLVDLADPGRRPSWAQAHALALAAGPLPSGSLVTLEPGGQIELSTPPAADVLSAVAALQADREVLRRQLAEHGFGAASLGADPARPVSRINPGARYLAMEAHFDALGCAESGRSMMSATAALQINLDAGPEEGWEDRLRLIRSMVPMLVAASSTSPYLGGVASGWHSMRQGTWQGIDHGRSDPVPGGEPTHAWAEYALDAHVMLLRTGSDLRAVTQRVSFRDWLRGDAPFGRGPTTADLDYHLTTLFPPVRPRGYVEIRCVDALPDRWWPAVVALTTTLVDDPVAADLAADICAPVAEKWESAARHGIADREVHRVVTACCDLAARRAPTELATQVGAFAELVASGRSPSGELRRRIEESSPLHVLEEEARA